jgi:predicted DNA-binding transcriptional regulator AlpA
MAASDLPIQPLAVDMAAAARMLGMSRSYLYELDSCGELGPRANRVGGKRLYSVEELAAWCRHGMPARSRRLEMWPAIRDGGGQ